MGGGHIRFLYDGENFKVLLYRLCVFVFSELEDEFEELLESAVSQKTSNIYRRYFNAYTEFCTDLSLPVHGTCSAKSVELWVASLSKKGLSYGTIQSHLSALRHMSKRNSVQVICQSDQLEIALKGIKKKGVAPSSKHAVSVNEVEQLQHYAVRALPSYMCTMFQLMVSLAFYGFLRPSEYCVTSVNHHLKLGDVKLSKSKRVCFLRLRTYKHSVSPAIIRISNSWSTAYSITELMQQYLEQNSHRPKSEPLFDISLSQFRGLLSKVWELTGKRFKITPHCFRHGGATWASKKRWSVVRIQAHGRWSSQAYNTYVKPY